MEPKKIILLLILMLGIIMANGQEFRLFEEGEKDGDRYYNYSLETDVFEKLSEQVLSASDAGRLFRLVNYDTIQLKYILDSKFFIDQKIAYDSTAIELEILPERDSLIEKKTEHTVTEVQDRINFDWQIDEQSIGDYRASNNWKWTKTRITKDTIFRITKCLGEYDDKEIVRLNAVKRKMLIFNPKEKINRNQLEGNFTTVTIYKVNSTETQHIGRKGGECYVTTNSVYLKRKGGMYILKETISDKEVKNKLKLIKTKLSGLGYYKGKINNEISLDFMNALMSYQKSSGLSIGQFDVETLNRLLE